MVIEETTRDGDSEIFILTNLPPTVATASTIAQTYRHRWSIKTLFQVLTDIFNCQIKTLAYPKAALFAFCVALVSYNILSVVLAALRSVHGIQRIEQDISSYYLADEISGTYRGMMIAISPEKWEVFNQIDLINLTKILKNLASKVNLAVFCLTLALRRRLRSGFRKLVLQKSLIFLLLKFYPKIKLKNRHFERAASYTKVY